MVGLGIDLGPADTAAAVRHDDGRVEMVDLGGASGSMATAGAVSADGGMPSAEQLRAVVGRCREAVGPVGSVALTHPDTWTEEQRSRYRDVAREAGVDDPVLVARTLAVELGAQAALDAPQERLAALGAAVYLGTEHVASGPGPPTALDDAFDRLGTTLPIEPPKRPAWLVPAVVAAVLVAGAVAVVLLLATGGGDGDDAAVSGTSTSGAASATVTTATTTEVVPTSTTRPPTTTAPTTTTSEPATTTVPTTAAPRTPTTAVYDLLAASVRSPAWTATPVPVGLDARSAVIAFGSIWVSMHGGNEVWRLDPATLAVQARIPTGAGPLAMTAGDLGMWVANALGDTVAFVDPATNQLGPPLLVGAAPAGLDGREGRIWVAVGSTRLVAEIDEANRQVVIESAPLPATPDGVAVVGDSLVVSSSPDADPVWRLDPIQLAVVADLGEPGGGSSSVAAGPDGRAVYIGYDRSNTITRVDVATGTVTARAALPGAPRFVVTADAVWVAPLGTTSILALDPVTLSTVANVDAGRPLTGGFAVGGDGIYLLDTPVPGQPSQLVKLTPADSG